MIHTATLSATEAAALALVEAAADEEALAGLAADVAETAPGRWQVVFYLEAAPGPETEAALARIAAAVLGRGAAFDLGSLPDTDWVAKSLAGLKPVAAGRFLVHGGHDSGRRLPNQIGVLIEAGEAFGTGHHGTTAGCLAAIDRLAKRRPVRRALDLGTGSGVLAIAIAKLCRAPVLATDIDPVATRVARANAALNGAAGRVTVRTAAGLAGRVFRERGPFDLVVANILAGPLVGLAPAIRRVLAPGGRLILSGILPGQGRRVTAAYRGQRLAFRESRERDGWLTLVFDCPAKKAEHRQGARR